MDKFEEAEHKGRSLFSGFCSTQEWCKLNKFSYTKYAPYDVSYWSGDTRILGEIKFREYPSTAFDNWYCKESKIKGLERIKKETDSRSSTDEKECQIQYIIFYTDGVVRIWNITNLTKEQNLISTTVTNTTMGDTSMVQRNQYLLDNNLTVYKGKYE